MAWWDVLFMGIPYSFAQYRLGEHYAALGQREAAMKHYTAFLDTFTQPDPEYAWMVEEARTRVRDLMRGR